MNIYFEACRFRKSCNRWTSLAMLTMLVWGLAYSILCQRKLPTVRVERQGSTAATGDSKNEGPGESRGVRGIIGRPLTIAPLDPSWPIEWLHTHQKTFINLRVRTGTSQ